MSATPARHGGGYVTLKLLVFDAASIADSLRWRACPARRTHRKRQVIQLFYSIAAMNALFSSMA